MLSEQTLEYWMKVINGRKFMPKIAGILLWSWQKISYLLTRLEHDKEFFNHTRLQIS